MGPNHKSVSAAFILAGAFLRLAWPEDMLWYRDQVDFQNFIAQALTHHTFPWLGLPSSAGVSTPGASMWTFILLSRVNPDPVFIMKCLQWLSLFSLLGWYAFIEKLVPERERKIWRWGFYLSCVSPMAVMYSRLYWPPTVLNLFCLFIFVGFQFRDRWWGSFLWGLIASVSSQIQMAGFWFVVSTAFVAWRLPKKVKWTTWFLGSAMGAIPLVYWMNHMLHSVGGGGKSVAVLNILTPKFWSYWFLESFGLYLHAAMKPAVFQFFAAPTWNGQGTYIVGVLHIVGCAIGVVGIRNWITGFRRQHLPRAELLGEYLWVAAAFGIFMQMTGLGQFPHYLQFIYPFLFFWVARILFHQHKAFCALVLVNAMLSIAYLTYVHYHQGVPGGYHDRTYQRYLEETS